MKIALSKFLGFIQAPTGTGRVARVEEALSPYDPQTDFYKRMRPAIVDALRSQDFAQLEQLPNRMKDERKRSNFPACVKGLRKWARKNHYEFISEAMPRLWTYEDLSIIVNPEALLCINGNSYWVKLYMSKPRLTPDARDTALYLISVSFDAAEGFPAILDVRRGELIATKPPGKRYGSFVESEAMAFQTISRSRRRTA